MCNYYTIFRSIRWYYPHLLKSFTLNKFCNKNNQPTPLLSYLLWKSFHSYHFKKIHIVWCFPIPFLSNPYWKRKQNTFWSLCDKKTVLRYGIMCMLFFSFSVLIPARYHLNAQPFHYNYTDLGFLPFQFNVY